MAKCRGLSWGRNNYPKNRLVNPPRRDTRALDPAGMLGEKAPLSGAGEQTLRELCDVCLLTFFANGEINLTRPIDTSKTVITLGVGGS